MPRLDVRQHSPRTQARTNGRTKLTGKSLDFGVRKSKGEYLSYRRVENGSPCFTFHADRSDLEITFSLPQQTSIQHTYSCKIPVAQVSTILHWAGPMQVTNLIVQLRLPPIVNRRTLSSLRSHHMQDGPEETRQVGHHILDAMGGPRDTPDFGRWLTYRLVIVGQATIFSVFRSILQAHNVSVMEQNVHVQQCRPQMPWTWLNASKAPAHHIAASLEGLHNAFSNIHLPFEVLYQLEVCLSNGWLYDGSFTPAFVQRLVAMIPLPPRKPTQVCKLLETVAAMKHYLEDPMQLFSQTLKTAMSQQRLPGYCTSIRAATVTPSTIYFHTPHVDTSNRILRRYRHLDDRFMRVKFRDELYRGRLQSQDNGSDVEVFNRVKSVLLTGITVGQRRFEFLAYGNSQFREHGAYFFAPTHDLTTEDIRRDMGSFEEIKVVAKYAARLGQSFSSTRATSNSVQLLDIPDISHHGHCFTDGIGRISLFMAQMIAQDMHLPTSVEHCPSAFQFRLAGCKGVLAVDKQVKGTALQIRPSQIKFPANNAGLEICRAAHFSSSFLNQQVILILSALGVPDEVFLARLRAMLADLDRLTSDKSVALNMLQRSVDINHVTIQLANMINAGLMQSKEPFLVICLQLWGAWTIKYLKEKARILVEQGAFLLGCVDERDVLRGHFELTAERQAVKDLKDLPEIFVQIALYDPLQPGRKTGYKIVQGLCIVTRNPALHPGDIRVVMAVDRPELHHLRDVVVFPQNGDRDLPSMCAGGDLDGDDFLVIWDPDMIPTEWNLLAMDYAAPKPVTMTEPVQVTDVVNFFVQSIRDCNLGRIATAHRYWADQSELGVKDEKCLQLASLHSQAVDYAKTGVPAPLPKHLKTVAWPHWAESKVHPAKVYRSKKILGQLYDLIDRVEFDPTVRSPFSDCIMKAFEPGEDVLNAAAALKDDYDTAIRELMLLHDIETEFEVWTGFVMHHNDNSNDYMLPEVLGRSMSAIKEHIASLAYERAGTNDKERDVLKMGPFTAAMYMVTAQQMANTDPTPQSGVQPPFISFPWIFTNELLAIVNSRPVRCLRSSTRKPAMRSQEVQSPPEPTVIPAPEATIDELAIDVLMTKCQEPVTDEPSPLEVIDSDDDLPLLQTMTSATAIKVGHGSLESPLQIFSVDEAAKS